MALPMSKAISLSPEMKKFLLDSPFMEWEKYMCVYVYVYVRICIYVYISAQRLEMSKGWIFGNYSEEQIVGILNESEIYTHLICNQNVSLVKTADHIIYHILKHEDKWWWWMKVKILPMNFILCKWNYTTIKSSYSV